MYNGDAYDRNGWAVLMAGGSMPDLLVKDSNFLQAAATMQPVASKDTLVKQWVLHNPQTGYVIHDLAKDKGTIEFDAAAGNYQAEWIDALKGDVQLVKGMFKGGKTITLTKPSRGAWVLWLKKK
jgi:hypothetical protein